MCKWHDSYRSYHEQTVSKHTLTWPRSNHATITWFIPLLSHATRYMTLGTRWQLSYNTDNIEINFIFSYISLAETAKHWQRGGNWSTQKMSLTKSPRKCHKLKPANKASTDTQTDGKAVKLTLTCATQQLYSACADYSTLTVVPVLGFFALLPLLFHGFRVGVVTVQLAFL